MSNSKLDKLEAPADSQVGGGTTVRCDALPGESVNKSYELKSNLSEYMQSLRSELVLHLIENIDFVQLIAVFKKRLASDDIRWSCSYSRDWGGWQTVCCPVKRPSINSQHLSDLWLQAVAVILPQVREEFDPSRVEFVTLALYAGLITGATIWGCLADVIGRKLSWQFTLSIAVRMRSFKVSKRMV